MHGMDVNFDLPQSHWSEIYEEAVQCSRSAAVSAQSYVKQVVSFY